MEFSGFVITEAGRALMLKLIGGEETDFTAIRLSDHVYSAQELETLTALEGVRQTGTITRKVAEDDATLQVEGAVDNASLEEGYSIQTIGLYAEDPDDGEILYAAARALTSGYMPQYNGTTVTGGYFKFRIGVGRTASVTLEVDPAGYASIGDILRLSEQMDALKGLFEVTYGTTAYAKISEAVSAGMLPYCAHDGHRMIYSRTEGGLHYFSSTEKSGGSLYIYTVAVSSSSVYTYESTGVSKTPSVQTISIPVASWNNKTATVSVTGVTAANLVQLTPSTKADSDQWGSFGVFCSAQGEGTLTFTCSGTPSAAISLGVVIW